MTAPPLQPEDTHSAKPPTRAWLEDKYVACGWTLKEIAEAAGVSESTVLRLFRRHGIVRRRPGRPPTVPIDVDESWLYERYVVDELSTEAIGELIGSSAKVVRRLLAQQGIDLRRGNHVQLPHHQLRDDHWLRVMYVEQERSVADIARMTGAARSTVHKALQRAGIERRPVGVAPNTRRSLDARLKDREWLREHFVAADMTAEEIADLVGCHRSTIYRALSSHQLYKGAKPV